MRRGSRRVLALAGAAVLAGMLTAGAMGSALAADAGKVDKASLPKSLHGAVETKAFTAGTVLPPTVPKAGSVLFDPGPAYAYSTLDRDDYGEGNLNFTMTARGANIDPGLIAAGGVFWPAPDCNGPDSPNVPCLTSGQGFGKGQKGTGVDTGLETAKGWPMYSEALYPDQPGQPSNQTAYKCILNKDVNDAPPTKGQFSEACKSGGNSVPFTSWATAVGDDIKSEGFSRGAGVDAPGVFSIGTSESHSLVQPDAGGVLHSTGYATVNSIDIGGGQIKIDQVRSEADIKSTADKVVSATGNCTMSGLTIAGNPVQQTTGGELKAEQLKPLLDQVQAATQLRVDIVAPTGVQKVTVEGAKQVVACAGLHIAITDERANTGLCSPAPPPQPPPDSGIPPSPQCVPPLGVRYELSFGSITVQQAVNAFAGGLSDTGGGAPPTEVAGTDFGANPSVPELPSADLAGGVPSSLNQTPFSAPRATRNFRGTGNRINAGAGFKLVGKNLAEVAGLTGGAAAALGLCVWLLLGVVDSVAKGTRLKLPGL